jgi:hypothetical protein
MIPRLLIRLALCAIGVAITLALAGCAPVQTLQGSGRPADPPAGYVLACEKNPALENCQP